jgi:hypothetical protein
MAAWHGVEAVQIRRSPQVLKKVLAPVVLVGALCGGALTAGTAAAATPSASSPSTSVAAPAATSHQAPRAWLRAHRARLRRAGAALSAKTIGVTTKQLVTELRTGKSVAQVAGEHGVSTQTVVNALVSGADARVDKAVANKTLTTTQASAIKAKLPALVVKAINHVVPQR